VSKYTLLIERLDNMAHLEEHPGTAELYAEAADALRESEAERELLQEVLDSRPAINAGLPETFVRWSQAIYSGEVFRAFTGRSGAWASSALPALRQVGTICHVRGKARRSIIQTEIRDEQARR
jgi:hypothetical protein